MIDQLIPNHAELNTSIYLGGPVTELMTDTPSYAATWREEFPSMLSTVAEEGKNFTFNNPCEGQYNSEGVFESNEYNAFRYESRYIMDKRVHQILSSDIILLNFLNCKEYFSPGTFWEIGFSFALKTKHLILVDEENGKARKHPIINLSTNFIASNLYEAAQYCSYLAKRNIQ